MFGTDPDRNRVLEKPPAAELIPCRRKPFRCTRLLRDPAQTQVWSKQVWLNTTFISQGSRSWDKLAVETIWARQNLPLLTSSWSSWRALVQILVDSVDSQTCRPQVIWRLRPLCFYWRRLSRTVLAGCTGMTCQNFRGGPKFMRPRKFSPFPVKNQKFYLGF